MEAIVVPGVAHHPVFFRFGSRKAVGLLDHFELYNIWDFTNTAGILDFTCLNLFESVQGAVRMATVVPIMYPCRTLENFYGESKGE